MNLMLYEQTLSIGETILRSGITKREINTECTYGIPRACDLQIRRLEWREDNDAV